MEENTDSSYYPTEESVDTMIVHHSRVSSDLSYKLFDIAPRNFTSHDDSSKKSSGNYNGRSPSRSLKECQELRKKLKKLADNMQSPEANRRLVTRKSPSPESTHARTDTSINLNLMYKDVKDIKERYLREKESWKKEKAVLKRELHNAYSKVSELEQLLKETPRIAPNIMVQENWCPKEPQDLSNTEIINSIRNLENLMLTKNCCCSKVTEMKQRFELLEQENSALRLKEDECNMKISQELLRMKIDYEKQLSAKVASKDEEVLKLTDTIQSLSYDFQHLCSLVERHKQKTDTLREEIKVVSSQRLKLGKNHLKAQISSIRDTYLQQEASKRDLENEIMELRKERESIHKFYRDEIYKLSVLISPSVGSSMEMGDTTGQDTFRS